MPNRKSTLSGGRKLAETPAKWNHGGLGEEINLGRFDTTYQDPHFLAKKKPAIFSIEPDGIAVTESNESKEKD